MKNLSEFYPRILPSAAGCPEPLVAQALVDTAIEFCDATSAVRYDLASIAVLAGTATYTTTPPAGEQVSRIQKVTFGGAVLTPVARDDMLSAELTSSQSTPVFYFTSEGESVFSITLYPTPELAGTLVVSVSGRPLRTATQLRDVLFNDWMSAMVSGTLAKLLRVPNQVYSNPQLSDSNASEFKRQIRLARVEGASGRVNTSRSVSMRAFT